MAGSSSDKSKDSRSLEAISKGIASMVPPSFDTDDDDDDDDYGLKPSDLYGWSHFAQFTIALVNKDPKKSKYSDTLHRFWKKEHDWGWKKFMDLSKVLDGFVDADTLVIKAQVQVIRERADRPFRCLDRQYRTELVRVYLSNVEQICHRFVEEKRGRLGKLIEDKVRWSSFCNFWSGIDQNSRRQMSREKSDSILKIIVKQFFVEKEVASTLVMDSLHSGLKALIDQTKNSKIKGKCGAEEVPIIPTVQIESDTFILVDGVLPLLERAIIEPLPPKDENGPQSRTKDGGWGEDFSNDSIERYERRLTELGRRTIEIFVLAHIFSKIEVAYQEAISLKRQEELIREEEEAWMAGSEPKAKRASEKGKGIASMVPPSFDTDDDDHDDYDVLHRFWRKEHDWGWKKFMVLSKVVNDGFVDDDALTVNAQVQVIREKIDRPFRCLGSIYRRELVSIYWSKVEQIYHQIVKKIRGQFENLLEDKVRWSSFCNIWLGADQEYRHRLSRVKSDFLLKAVVKLIFIEKEVTSTLLMDSLYNGLRALKGQTKSNTVKGKCDAKELPLVQMESDTFILVDDVLTLLGRAVLEPLPLKDENGPQNCTQDGGSWKDFVENKERRLAELGQRTIELIVLAYISSKIDLASQEALALKRQEELIREEEMEKAAKQSRHQNQNEKQKQKQKRACDKRSKGTCRPKISFPTSPLTPSSLCFQVKLE
ncbi:hypothetical protein L1987_25696 [Smallanthus sonchifolius]|uniref:Uncharacterized protein n=1 Tax=Smallanthus sonchifolius TaxID=185202 RepID=A0ACB9I936_9ASTR|nr:hypothetical protein L1987_25696 [Smallanthus sonchifolius]